MATSPKTPQDRKPKTEDTVTRFEDVDGSDLLKPFSQVKGSDQLRLMNKLRAGGFLDATEGSIAERDLEPLADLIDWVSERFAVEQDAFEAFTSGRGGYNRALDLVIAYAGVLGESDSSKS